MTEHLIGEALLERLEALEVRSAQQVKADAGVEDVRLDDALSVRGRHEQAIQEARLRGPLE